MCKKINNRRMAITVRWGAQTLSIPHAVLSGRDGATHSALIAHLTATTGVPVERIRLTSKKGRRIRTESDLLQLRQRGAVALMMVGSAASAPTSAPVAASTAGRAVLVNTATGTTYLLAWGRYWAHRGRTLLCATLTFAFLFVSSLLPCVRVGRRAVPAAPPPGRERAG